MASKKKLKHEIKRLKVELAKWENGELARVKTMFSVSEGNPVFRASCVPSELSQQMFATFKAGEDIPFKHEVTVSNYDGKAYRYFINRQQPTTFPFCGYAAQVANEGEFIDVLIKGNRDLLQEKRIEN